jgi:predicted SPOUT superfamily RNA methylase MTH1
VGYEVFKPNKEKSAASKLPLLEAPSHGTKKPALHRGEQAAFD